MLPATGPSYSTGVIIGCQEGCRTLGLCRAMSCPAGFTLCRVMLCRVLLPQVTTKKGYDGCRKAEYLFAHQPITDKTFATLGETTISNLKAKFEGVETGEVEGAGIVCCSKRDPGHVGKHPHARRCMPVMHWVAAGGGCGLLRVG